MAEIDETKVRLQTHEEVCALRYEGLCARLKRLEGVALKPPDYYVLSPIAQQNVLAQQRANNQR